MSTRLDPHPFSVFVALILGIGLLSWITGVPQLSMAVAEQVWGYDFQNPFVAMWGVPLATLWGGVFWLAVIGYADLKHKSRRPRRRRACAWA